MLISLYLDDNIGRDELDEHGEGNSRAPCFAEGSRVNHGQPLETHSRRWGRERRKPFLSRWLDIKEHESL